MFRGQNESRLKSRIDGFPEQKPATSEPGCTHPYPWSSILYVYNQSCLPGLFRLFRPSSAALCPLAVLLCRTDCIPDMPSAHFKYISLHCATIHALIFFCTSSNTASIPAITASLFRQVSASIRKAWQHGQHRRQCSQP